MLSRVEKFEAALAQTECDAVLVTNLKNIYYLTGFSGTEATVFISKTRRIFLTDARYTLIAKGVVQGFDIVETRDAIGEIVKIIADDKLQKIGFEDEISYAYFKMLESVFSAYELVPMTGFIENLRMIKDEQEIATIRKACQISDQAFLDVLDFIKPGETTELAVMNFLDARMRQLGASGASFDFIIASGYRSAMPHGVASDKIIEAGDFITFDFGAVYKGFHSDMTRTVVMGPASEQQKKLYSIVLEAQKRGVAAVRAGITGKELDAICRDYIKEHGYTKEFNHGTGHGLGLEIHEEPVANTKSDTVFTENMIITVEPGIYITGTIGLRIEDSVIVKSDGYEVLTHSPKELIEISI